MLVSSENDTTNKGEDFSPAFFSAEWLLLGCEPDAVSRNALRDDEAMHGKR
jgi:hypothetical protein